MTDNGVSSKDKLSLTPKALLQTVVAKRLKGIPELQDPRALLLGTLDNDLIPKKDVLKARVRRELFHVALLSLCL